MGQRSGNKLHDTRSGKFGQGGGPARPVTPPANVDPLAYKRELDAVRGAARSLDTLDESAITDFLQGRSNSPDQVDIQNFMAMVQEQRKADLLDIIDDSLREHSSTVKLTAQPGEVAKLMRQLGSDDVAEIMHRLEGMGHSTQDVERYFDGRISVAEEAKKKRDAIRGPTSG